MRHSIPLALLIAALGLSACNKTPPPPAETVVAPASAPGPQGPASLQGASGVQGSKVNAGDPGPQGAIGDQGSKGNMSDTGAQGAPGGQDPNSNKSDKSKNGFTTPPPPPPQ